MATATANGEAVGDLGLLCARLEAAGGRLDAQLEVISDANLSPSMLNAALKPLRARVDAFERVATDLATIAATSIADVHGVELDAINDGVAEVRHLVRARPAHSETSPLGDDRTQGGVMSTTQVRSVDMRVEVITIPVSDVDRTKEFYGKVGWRLDVTPPGVVQFTPPGSGCSVQFGANRTSAAPGSAQNTFLVVSDIQAARDQLVAAGIEVSEVSHPGPDGPVSGPDPEHRSYLSFASFNDPDGNSWLLQEITTRLPGHVEPAATSFDSANDLANAMRRAAAAHGEHEKRTGEADANWPDWYADYMVAEHAGTELPL